MRVIDLAGPEGNAFVLMGLASRWAKDCNMDADALLDEMMSGDYKNLLDVFDRNFGMLVSFENDPRAEEF